MTAEIPTSDEINAEFIDFVVSRPGKYALEGSEVIVRLPVDDVPAIQVHETVDTSGLQLVRVVHYEYDSDVQSILRWTEVTSAKEQIQFDAEKTISDARIALTMKQTGKSEAEVHFDEALRILRTPIIGEWAARELIEAASNTADYDERVASSAIDIEVQGLLNSLSTAPRTEI